MSASSALSAPTAVSAPPRRAARCVSAMPIAKRGCESSLHSSLPLQPQQTSHTLLPRLLSASHPLSAHFTAPSTASPHPQSCLFRNTSPVFRSDLPSLPSPPSPLPHPSPFLHLSLPSPPSPLLYPLLPLPLPPLALPCISPRSPLPPSLTLFDPEPCGHIALPLMPPGTSPTALGLRIIRQRSCSSVAASSITRCAVSSSSHTAACTEPPSTIMLY